MMEPDRPLAATEGVWDRGVWDGGGVAQDPRDDGALLRDIARGDELALACLYDRHAGWLTVRLSRRCSSPDLVDHTLQDTFLAVWRDARRYRGDGDVGAFLWGIAVRRLVDLIRRDRPRRRLPWLPQSEEVASAEDQVLAGIEHGRLAPALASLSPDLLAALEATVLDGLSCAEAAVLLGVAEGTVKSRCHRAREALRALLVEPATPPDTVWGLP
jgi:RNA polymerase sigma-70 factor, ECF subfamily